jgi:hypothetical protein
MKKIFLLVLIMLLVLPNAAFADGRADVVQIQGDVVIAEGEEIAGDAVAILGSVTVNGRVLGDVVAVMGDVRVNGEVMGDVTAVGGKVIRGETSKINGKVAQVGIGEGISEIINNFKRRGFYLGPAGMSYFNLSNRGFLSGWRFINFLGILALGILAILLFPGRIKKAAEAVDQNAGKRILIGFAVLVLTPIVLLLVALTIIGIPLIPILLLLLVIGGFYGYLGISIFLGQKLSGQLQFASNIYLNFVIGALLLWLIKLVPFIGALSAIIVTVLAIGISADTRFGFDKS